MAQSPQNTTEQQTANAAKMRAVQERINKEYRAIKGAANKAAFQRLLTEKGLPEAQKDTKASANKALVADILHMLD